MRFRVILSLISISTNLLYSNSDRYELPDEGCYKCLNRWQGISKVIGYATWPLEIVEGIYRRITYFIDDINERNRVKNINKEREEIIKKYYCKIENFDNCIDNINKLNKNLSKIVGQKEAIKNIRESVISIIEKYHEFDFIKAKKLKELEEKKKDLEKDLQKKKVQKKKRKKILDDFGREYLYKNAKYLNNGPGCTFIYFVGPAGTGKTETALTVAESISNNKQPYIIDAATVLANGGTFSSLLKEEDIRVKKNRNGKAQIKSHLDIYFRETGRGIIIFNEIDKILVDQKLATDLNETLRTLKDNNYYVASNGEKVDVSGFIFIFTSNEKIDTTENDETNSMTKVHFDQSLRTRFRIIRFSTFKEEEYRELIKRYLNVVRNSYIEMYKKYDININFENNIEKYCAKYIFSDKYLRNRGARSIYDVLSDDLKSKLFILIEDLKSKNILKNKTFFVSFNDKTNKFEINTHSFIEHDIKEVSATVFAKIKKYFIIMLLLILLILLIRFFIIHLT